MKSEVIDAAGCKVHLVRNHTCPLADHVEALLTAIGLLCHVTHRETIPAYHAWLKLSIPSLLTVEDSYIQDVVWDGNDGNLDEDRLIALLYSRSSSFRFLLSNLAEAETGISGTVWIANGAAPSIKPRVFLTATRTDTLEDGVCVSICKSPEVLFAAASNVAASVPELCRFVARNLKPLIDNWDSRPDTMTCLERLKRQD